MYTTPFSYWLPTTFCGAICAIALVGSIGSQELWTPAFFAFLPMCFYYAGVTTARMQREIHELRKQVGELQEKLGIARSEVTEENTEQKFQFSIGWILVIMLLLSVGLALTMTLWNQTRRAVIPPPAAMPAEPRVPK